MKAIYGILLLLITFSCAKDGGGFLGLGEGGETTVKGKVTARGSGKAVANAQVILKPQPEGSWMALFSADTVVYTNSKGEYSLSFIADEDRDYEIQPRHELFDNRQNYKEIRSGRKNIIDLELDPWGWVKIQILDQPPLDTVRYISFSGFHNQPNHVQGFSGDTILYGRVTGNFNSEIYVFWAYNVLNWREQTKIEHIYVQGHDTVDYYFKY